MNLPKLTRASCLGSLLTLSLCVCVVNALAKDSSPVTQDEIDIGEPFSISDKFKPGDEFMGVRLLGAVRIKAKKVKGEKPRELSGLAWDADENLLLAISDDGLIVHLRPDFEGDLLTGVKMTAIYPLLSADGQPLEERLRDAEGLVGRNMSNGIQGDSILYISFEETPRIDKYSMTGEYLDSLDLPAMLQARQNYAGDNQELEALTEHPQYGMITAPERPLRNSGTQFFSLYGVDGSIWHYPSLDHEHSALVGMDTMPNGNLLVLERRFASMFQPIVFALRELQLAHPEQHEARLVRDVIKFSSTDGWKIDNFESVTHHQNDRYFVISDDNESVFQKTLLVYLQVNPEESAQIAETP